MRRRRRYRRGDVDAGESGWPASQCHGRSGALDFHFSRIVDRGDVVVAVGTGGMSPVVARRVRERIEAMLPARIGDLANFIGRWRKTVHGRISEMSLRRRFWERVSMVRSARWCWPVAAMKQNGRWAASMIPRPLPELRHQVKLRAKSWAA